MRAQSSSPGCLAALALALVGSASCALVNGASGDDGDDEADAASTPDAPGGVCLAESIAADALVSAPAKRLEDQSVLVFATLDTGDNRDFYGLQLRPDEPPFTGALAPGLYRAEDSATNYATCGLCVVILADVVTGAPAPKQVFVADSASVNIEEVTDTFIKGTISPAQLVGFDVSGTGAILGPNGCRAEAEQTSFETEIVPE